MEYPETIAYPNHEPHYCTFCARWCDYLLEHGAVCRIAAERFYIGRKKAQEEL